MSAPSSTHVPNLVRAMLTTQRSSWEQGVAAQSLLEYIQFLRTYSRQKLLPELSELEISLYGMVHEAILRRSIDGRLATRVNSDDNGSSDGGALDPACIGQSVIFIIDLMETNGDDAGLFEQALEDMYSYLCEKSPRMKLDDNEQIDGLEGDHDRFVLSHTTRKPQLWVDGVYMGPPFLASYALRRLSWSPSSEDWIKPLHSTLDQIILYFHYLRLPSGLLAHIYDCNSRGFATEVGGGMYGGQAWGVGNGWAIGGIVRVLHILHQYALTDTNRKDVLLQALETHQLKARFKVIGTLLIRTLDAIIGYMREDGLFHNVIDDSSTFVETNLSQMVAATIYRLLYLLTVESRICAILPQVKDEWKMRMEANAQVMRNAAVAKVDKWGFVQGVASSPRFDRPGTATEGQAWGILMEVARAAYITSKQ